MQGQFLIIGSYFVICIIIVIVALHFIRRGIKNKYRKKVSELEVAKNMVASTPISLELSKVEPIIKNDKMEEKYNDWQDRFDELREHRLSIIDDMLIDLDIYIDKKDYKTCVYRLAKTELEIYKARESAEYLLDEIKEITLSEEKYRAIVTKLKTHIEIVIREVPDLLLMAKQIIPNRMKEVKDLYDDMVKQEYPLDYLNIDYNLEESKKNIDQILDKIRVLNLEDCMFELKTMLEYFDSLFVDFEKERLSRKVYEEMEKDFSKKLEKTNKIVQEIYNQLDDIKNMYDLNDNDVETIHEVNKILVVINCQYALLMKPFPASDNFDYAKLGYCLIDLCQKLSQCLYF